MYSYKLTKMIVYGIKNCDTVKKALQWLKKKKIDFEFHDYKASGITEKKLKEWSKQVGWEILLNKRGRTFSQLEDTVKERITNETVAIKLMIEKTSVIKRPVIEKNGKILIVGFNEEEYKKRI